MSGPEPLRPATLPPREEVLRRFAAAWADMVPGSPTPDIETFLSPFSEPERSAVRSELETMQAAYQRALTGEAPEVPQPMGVTLDYPPRAPIRNQPATVDFTPAGAADHESLDPPSTADIVSARVSSERSRGTCDEAVAAPPSPEGMAAQTVAGYEILAELGRGTMGVVYKARQPGLKRVVALKMILAGVHAGEHERNRFRAEAEAVARLQHPNIIQVHEVGADDGCPFFSLEYVEGTSLDRKIRGTPQPPREAAHLAQTLAQAMDYAHSRGVIHRDLKPANVLLSTDGTPKIGDFGLAKRLEDDTGQTRTGAILGTPSYMAPEQAEGRPHEVGPLSDVYALGAILYELLTGQPPFRATSVVATLAQVRTREPVAPTQLQPGVPCDVETICLKCLQKDPARRYPTAGALADDLKRFLAGEPIVARPVGRLERAWRWCRRNPAVAGLTAAVALTLVAGTGVALGFAAQASANATEARDQADRARASEQQARELADRARKNEDEARRNAVRTEKAAAAAKRQHHQAVVRMIDLVEKLQNRLRSKRLPARADPEMRKLRDDMLVTLKQSLLGMAREMEGDEVSSFAAAATYQQFGDLLKKLGQGTEALRMYRQGYELVKRVADAQPDSDLARANLAVFLQRLGDVVFEVDGDARAARKPYTQAHDLQREILLHPRSRQYTPLQLKTQLSHSAMRLGKVCLALGDPAAARKHFQESLDFRKAWTEAETKNVAALSYLSESHYWLAVTAWHLEDEAAVQEQFRLALAICEKLAAKYPQDVSFKGDLAEVYGALGDSQLRAGQPEAAQSYEKALANLQAVFARNPDQIASVPLLAQTHERLGTLALRRQQREVAEKHFREALELRQELVQLDPANLTWQAAHLQALARCGEHARACSGAEKLRRRVPHSTELLLRVADCFGVCAALDTPEKPQYVAKALEALQAATRDDYKDAVALQTDPELEPLRQEPVYQTVLGKIKARQSAGK
jgi:serine/threonine-protein kinase